jgi:hypothetical protein
MPERLENSIKDGVRGATAVLPTEKRLSAATQRIPEIQQQPRAELVADEPVADRTPVLKPENVCSRWLWVETSICLVTH